MHFQTTLPFLRKADVVNVFFLLVLVSVFCLSRVLLGRGKLFTGGYLFFFFSFGKRGVTVRRARQGRQFVIMARSTVIWAGT